MRPVTMKGSSARTPPVLLRVYGGDHGHVHDIVHVGAALQYMHRLCHPHQNRSDGIRPTDPAEQLVADVRRVEIRENEHIGRSPQLGERIGLGQDPLTTAVSACISPSACSAGSRSWSSATARCTFSAVGWRTEPKFENESSATRGSIPSRPTNWAVADAISASVSESGSMFTAQSAKKSVCCGSTSM